MMSHGDVAVTRPPPVTDIEASMYIDPTAGSLVLQIVAAAALSAVAMAGRVRESVKSFFRSINPRRGR